MTANKVTQKGATASGDIAGRDINKTYVVETENKSSEILKALYKKYKEEKETQTHTDNLVEDLSDYYVLTDDAEVLRDLEAKLKAGNRDDLLKRARIFKQRFRQKIERYRLLPAAQQIYAFLLGQILTRFYAHATPAIKNGIDADEVTKIIEAEVIDFVLKSIPDCEPSVDAPTLHGMVYFLTGNCFIEWEGA